MLTNKIIFYSWLIINLTFSNFLFDTPNSKPISNTTNAPGWEERTDWPDDYPRPPKTDRSLFFIQRNWNMNTVVYDVDMANGQIDNDNPIEVYWLRYGSDGSRKELNWIQTMFAYGYSSKQLDDSFKIRLRAYKKKLIKLEEIDGQWKAWMSVNDKPCYLNNIYVFVDETGIFPDVKYVDIYGTDPVTGIIEKERIYNN